MSSRPMLTVVAALVAMGCSATTPHSDVASADVERTRIEKQSGRELLCSDIGEETCLAACPDALGAREHGECLLALRFGTDREALKLARDLYLGTNTLVGTAAAETMKGFPGERVDLLPALPIGARRHHLAWLHASLEAFDAFTQSVSARAAQPVVFEPRAKGFIFFRTPVPSYPSAYSWHGFIGYNLDGPLHVNARDVRETLFHELFHLNDAREGWWSDRALGGVFEAIVEKCAGKHACFTPFAPHDTIVRDGTYYAFDERTRHVREYAAELALRYFLEHQPLFTGGSMTARPFKCLTKENGIAWSRMIDHFFGGVDLTPRCHPAGSSESAEVDVRDVAATASSEAS